MQEGKIIRLGFVNMHKVCKSTQIFFFFLREGGLPPKVVQRELSWEWSVLEGGSEKTEVCVCMKLRAYPHLPFATHFSGRVHA